MHACQSRSKSQAAETCPAEQKIRQWSGNKGHYNGKSFKLELGY